MTPKVAAPSLTAIRAAIYTRVSTDEGLAMEFNSLHAQREACEAYVLSQKHEGWDLVDGHYDDGGFSGGTLKRPALERLLADVESGLIDTIVVYKIDRLTRSLADFARIIDVLDVHGASFISVTQAFSTTTSMGRLTLNVLLSFAQFEREVGAERVRDKIASSKKKGIWMGGVVPLGYDVRDRRLEVNQQEAETVRHIFERYRDLRSVIRLEQELSEKGFRSKRRVSASGTVSGGRIFTRGALYALLRNPIYIGRVRHHSDSYPGQHDAIISDQLFAAVQNLLGSSCRGAGKIGQRREPPLLSGLLFDRFGRPMSPSHTAKGSKRYRYYCSRQMPGSHASITRVPAGDIERLAVSALTSFLGNTAMLSDLVGDQVEAEALQSVLLEAAELRARLAGDDVTSHRDIVRRMVVRAVIGDHELELIADVKCLCERARFTPVAPRLECSIVVPFRRLRRSKEIRLVIQPQITRSRAVDPSMVRLAVTAHAAKRALLEGGGASLAEVASRLGYERHYFSVLVKLAYLAPDITEAILEGKQPAGLDRQRLARMRALPMDWEGQRRILEFQAAHYQ